MMNIFDWDQFNADDSISEETGYRILEPGKYKAQIMEAIIKDTKAGTGKYLSLTLQVTEGEFEGCFVYDNLNLINPNSDAVRIAQARLKRITNIAGFKPSHESELEGIEIGIEVGYDKPRNGQIDKTRNRVVAYLPLNDTTGKHQEQPQQQPQRQAFGGKTPAQNGAKKPWQR